MMIDRKSFLLGACALPGSAALFGLGACQSSSKPTSGTLHHLIGLGQSQMAGVTPGSEAVSTTATAGIEMFSCGIRPLNKEPSKENFGDSIPADCVDDFKPAVEQEQQAKSVYEETPMTGAAVYAQSAKTFKDGDKILLSNSALGGASIKDLLDDSATLENTKKVIEAAKKLSEAREMVYDLPAILFSQGWSNRGTDRESYEADYLEFIARVRAITEFENTIPFINAQMSETNTGQITDVMTVQFELPKLIEQGFCVGPSYHIPHAKDGLHFTSRGSRQFGAYFGKVIAKTAEGQNWQPLHATKTQYESSTKTVRVFFHVPNGELVFDKTIMPELPHKGFTLSSKQSSLKIQSVSRVDEQPNAIDIFLNEIPKTDFQLGLGAKHFDGEVSAEGNYENMLWTNIRDSDLEIESLTGLPLHNWACHQVLDVHVL